MNIIISLLTAFCASAVFIGALYMICPEGAINKTVKFVLGLAFLLSVIAASGISLNKTDIYVEIPKTETADSDTLDIAVAKYVYSYTLKNSGIDFSEITVCTDKSADGSIYISKVIIKSQENREKILNALGEAGKNIEVEIKNE